MVTIREAVYERGALRLEEPLALAEGTRVRVIIEAAQAVPPPVEPNGEALPFELPADIEAILNDPASTPAQRMMAIASLPMQEGGEEFSGRDHDRILYGEKGAR